MLTVPSLRALTCEFARLSDGLSLERKDEQNAQTPELLDNFQLFLLILSFFFFPLVADLADVFLARISH